MSVHRIEAVIDCDGCGHRFSVELDPAYKPKCWSLWDCAVDGVRGGQRGTIGDRGHTSVQGGLCLCPVCTGTVDEYTGDDPSPEDISRVLAAHR
jgi:hypothetical protein